MSTEIWWHAVRNSAPKEQLTAITVIAENENSIVFLNEYNEKETLLKETSQQFISKSKTEAIQKLFEWQSESIDHAQSVLDFSNKQMRELRFRYQHETTTE